MTTATVKQSFVSRYLDPAGSLAEVVFGLIMVVLGLVLVGIAMALGG